MGGVDTNLTESESPKRKNYVRLVIKWVCISIAVVSAIVYVSGLVLGIKDQSHWGAENIVCRHSLSSGDEGAASGERNLTLAVLEFSEAGNRYEEHEQLENIRAEIKSTPKGAPISIVIFAHGWNNNAMKYPENAPDSKGEGDPGEGWKDLKKFHHAMVKQSRYLEDPRTHLVGIYLGWRGKSTRALPAHWLTLGARRNVARHIGRSPDLQEAIIQIVEEANSATDQSKTILFGHSLGAALVEKTALTFSREPAGGPDAFILLNSAELADTSRAAFEEINQKAIDAEKENPDKIHLPKVISITSETDTAVGKLNPRTSWLFEGKYSKSLGFEESMQTHQLVNLYEQQLDISEGDVHIRSDDDVAFFERCRAQVLNPVLWIERRGNPEEGAPRFAYPYVLQPIESSNPQRGGFWNILVPENMIADHYDLQNPRGIGAYLSFAARTEEWVDLKDQFALLYEFYLSDETTRKAALKTKTNRFFGLIAQSPRNKETVAVLLELLDAELVQNEGFLPKEAEGGLTAREELVIAMFQVLKEYNDPAAGYWDPANRDTLKRIRDKDRERSANRKRDFDYFLGSADYTEKGDSEALTKFKDDVIAIFAPEPTS